MSEFASGAGSDFRVLCGGMALATVLCTFYLATPVRADVTISSAQTENMSCSGGVCAPTATAAILNVADLENLLASGNVEVTTTGSGVQATDMHVEAPLSWSSTSTLALDAYHKIRVEKPVTVSGQGGLSVRFNDGGSGGYFGFGWKGHVTFAKLSSPLTINGVSYTLVSDIKSLASAVAANPAGSYALANSYDASQDGIYGGSPVATELSGIFDGLGNAISNLTIDDTISRDTVGLFTQTGSDNQPGGEIDNARLDNFSISGTAFVIGGLVGLNRGAINGSSASGSATSDCSGACGPEIGLLVGVNFETISRSEAGGNIMLNDAGAFGCITGANGPGPIKQSFGNCKISAAYPSELGGLTGDESQASIGQSYAGGSIDREGFEGGLVGFIPKDVDQMKSTITQSYSTVLLSGGTKHDRYAGGLIGVDYSHKGNNTYCYWDITTSDTRHAAGNRRHDPGVTGLTSKQLKSGLPEGFDPSVWAEDPKINNGLPYLIDNPPEN